MKSSDGPPTADEIMYASGKKLFDAEAEALYTGKLEKHTTSIKEAFARQEAAAAVSIIFILPLPIRYDILFQLPWDQPEFERRFIEWIIACDQPFDEVQKPEFIAMMEYGRDPKTFSLPKRDGVHRRVMALGKETIQETKDMFSVCIFL